MRHHGVAHLLDQREVLAIKDRLAGVSLGELFPRRLAFLGAAVDAVWPASVERAVGLRLKDRGVRRASGTTLSTYLRW
jgi:hypothetical protein